MKKLTAFCTCAWMNLYTLIFRAPGSCNAYCLIAVLPFYSCLNEHLHIDVQGTGQNRSRGLHEYGTRTGTASNSHSCLCCPKIGRIDH